MMKRTLTMMLSVLSISSLLGLAVDSHAERACTTASLKGTFGYTCQGTFGDNPPLPAAEVGIGTYDGAGKASGKSTLSVSGTAPTATTWTGSYTINADCSGTITFGDGSHAALVLDDNKKQLRVIATDPGAVYTCLKKKQ